LLVDGTDSDPRSRKTYGSAYGTLTKRFAMVSFDAPKWRPEFISILWFVVTGRMERLRGGCGLDPGVGTALQTWLHTALAVQVPAVRI
jgi:hypothetical protein